ncbi:MAG: lamin tail domain-containing protein [Bacteroidales bacterium]|nr:lamin tail domain-containing protein [Bacteroidales bacterium]
MKHIFTSLLIMMCALYNHAQIIHENDIVINEIMADPSPSVALPEWEYIELYNASESAININDWKIIIGKKELPFNENIIIQSDEYLILCHKDALDDMTAFGNCHGFSSFQITNSGSNITLVDENENLISTVSFNISWHSTSYKKDGGWSLEQIDAFNPCAGKSNWGSCNNKNGGTPGTKNSIINQNVIAPKLDHINPSSDNEIEVFFNQNMNLEDLQNIDNYFIKELNLYPEKAETLQYKNDYVKLTFDYIFEEGKLYTLNINNVTNCKDIPPEEEIEIRFGIPSVVNHNDIIINEILFNPISPGVDYLELYNRSDKVIDLKEIMFGTIKETFPNPADTTLKEICADSRIMLPHSYILLSLDQEIVRYQYDVEEDNNFLDVESFPSLPNEEGHVIICDKGRTTIDEMKYSDKMHYDLLSITQGVALERISTKNPSLDENNWHSASFNFNYGTPGYRNSVAKDDVTDSKENEIDIIPEIFSPDGDAKDDICSIYYNLDDIGYTLNIKIFNSDGLLIRNLFNNNLVSKEGCVYWDGSDDNNRSISSGIYIVQTEIFNLNGNVKRCRNVVVVARN